MLHRQMLETLSIPNAEEIVKLPDDIKPNDPVTENMMMLKQEPTKAFAYQDHEAHIATHMAMMNDPKIRELVGQSPFASAIQGAMIEHITEHVALQYRKEVEKQLGVPLPAEDELLPEDVERDLAPAISQAAQQVLRNDQAEMAEKKAKEAQQDPLTQIQQRELALKEAEFQHKREVDLAKLQSEAMNKEAQRELERDRIESQERQEGARLGVKIATEQDKMDRQEQIEGVKIGVQIAESIAKEE
jgi:monoamine oxidase